MIPSRSIALQTCRIVRRVCSLRFAAACYGVRAVAVVAVVGFCLMLFGAPSVGGEEAWLGEAIAPPSVSTVRFTASADGVRASLSRTVLDRVEGRLIVDSGTGVGLSARVGVVDLVPLEIVLEMVWRGPVALAANWRLGPLGIHLQRKWGPIGTVEIGSKWAVSDRLILGGGWTRRRADGDRLLRGWLVWAEILARRRWLGWTVWIGGGGCGVSWQRSWVY